MIPSLLSSLFISVERVEDVFFVGNVGSVVDSSDIDLNAVLLMWLVFVYERRRLPVKRVRNPTITRTAIKCRNIPNMDGKE